MISFKPKHLLKTNIVIVTRWHLPYPLNCREINAWLPPTALNVDKSNLNTAAFIVINKTLSEIEQIKPRQNKYLNNMVGQDHRFIKTITGATLGFKAIHLASITNVI